MEVLKKEQERNDPAKKENPAKTGIFKENPSNLYFGNHISVRQKNIGMKIKKMKKNKKVFLNSWKVNAWLFLITL